MILAFRDVAQVVERYFREVEAASSSLVAPTKYLKGSERNLRTLFHVYCLPWNRTVFFSLERD